MGEWNWDCGPHGELAYLNYHEELLQRHGEEEATPAGAVRIECPPFEDSDLPF